MEEEEEEWKDVKDVRMRILLDMEVSELVILLLFQMFH